MKRLGVNIDHIATLRNARGSFHPNLLLAAKLAIKYGANSITIHLREDRRHIKDNDLEKLSKYKNLPINLEIAANMQMLKIALKNKPDFVCIVPEKRKEITTEGGLNIKKNIHSIRKIIKKLKKSKIRVSLFIEPKIQDVKLAKSLGSDCVELHTGKFCNLFNKRKRINISFFKIKNSAEYAKKLGLEVHAGHGLTYDSTLKISRINSISEFNIGHFIIAESLFLGLKNAIRKFKKIINK